MTSQREDILALIKTTITPATGISSRVFRGRPDPVRISETPCIFLNLANDVPNYDQLNFMEWNTTVRIEIVVRGDAPDTLVDPIAKSVHSLLMADRSLGGIALDVLPAEQRMDIITGDKPIGVLSCLWRIRHRTEQNSLTA